MPSTPRLLFDLTVSVGLLVGGAWFAAQYSSPANAAGETAPPVAEQLTLTIEGIRNDTGKVIALVFDQKEAFEAYDIEKTVGFQEVKAQLGNSEMPFESLASGPYAVVLFHDENGDYDLNMENGLPLEGYGTTGSKGIYDDPGFDQALVSPGTVTVQMYYLQ